MQAFRISLPIMMGWALAGLLPIALIGAAAILLTEPPAGFEEPLDPHLVILAMFGAVFVLAPVVAVISWFFKVFISPEGVRCYNFWGTYRTVEWADVARADRISMLGLKFILVHSRRRPDPLWLPRFLSNRAAFDQLVAQYAGVDHPLTQAMEVSKVTAAVPAIQARVEESSGAATELSASPTPQPCPEEFAPALAEIEQLQHAQGTWTNAILVLAVSLAIFFGVGAAAWSARTALLLIPILFFHELGHYLAMRAFKYGNVRMFFIPLFGAAVSGRHFNAPGWKKVVVSLLGPLPGIVVGAVLGLVGYLLDEPLLFEIALLMLILNGFNLLPILPLDGGWVLHTILFCRHYLLDAVFRGAAVCLLIIGGIWLKDFVLPLLGAVLLLGLPLSYRLARIAADLRSRMPEVSTVSPDDQTVPVATACAILQALKSVLPPAVSPNILAKCTLSVFETVNTRPPGPWATATFAFVHAFSFVFALACGVAIVIAQHGGLGQFARDVSAMPKYTLNPDVTQIWRGTDLREDGPIWTPVTVFATFTEPAAADKAFRNLTATLPSRSAARLIGQSILIELPSTPRASRTQWLKDLGPLCTEVFIEDGDKNGVDMALACFAPSAQDAAALAVEAKTYFQLPAEALLIPPWSGTHKITAAQRQARLTYHQIQNAVWESQDARTEELSKRIAQAARRGDKQTVDELLIQHRARHQELRQRHVHKLKHQDPAGVDQELVELILGAPEDHAEKDKEFAGRARKWHLALGERMGQLPNDKGLPKAGTTRFSAGGAMVAQRGLLIQFHGLNFVRAAEGALALIHWLRDRKCVGFKYEFRPVAVEDAE